MRSEPPTARLGPREREIVEILYKLGEATAAEVRVRLRGDPSDSSVRTMLSLLESKGHVRHRREGRAFVYAPTRTRDAVKNSALQHVVDTFFAGSVSAAMTTLVRESAERLSKADIERLRKLIDELPEE